jgi:OPA family glycerol-3-phosphate transporter-like MFS transporter
MCRYNLALSNQAISAEFGFSKAQMGTIITTALLAYASGLIINGLLADHLGGKKAMLIGAVGTIFMNLIFGVASFWGFISLFVTIRGLDGYLQAFGAPGMVKINASWFQRTERGRFAGIFGLMINLGRFGIFTLGPALLGGFVFLGIWRVPPLHWRWLFWIPACLTAVIAIIVAFIVKETPQQAGFPALDWDEVEELNNGRQPSIREVFRTIASNPIVWIIACAYACTGAVRQGIDQWFPRFMQEVHHIDYSSLVFQFLGFMIPFVASIGALVSGYVSDALFDGRRTPVAAVLYLAEAAIALMAASSQSATSAVVFLILISFTANGTHSLLGTAAPMDIAGARMAGFATGLIDSFQYFGGSLAGYVLGLILDKGWGWYFCFMIPFGCIGGLLMYVIRGRISLRPASSILAPNDTL